MSRVIFAGGDGHSAFCRVAGRVRRMLRHRTSLGRVGTVFGYSDTWQLVINTATTIVTFLMVFLIQNTQNRDGAAIQAKLDELIRATAAVQNRYIAIEELAEEELADIRQRCQDRAAAKASSSAAKGQKKQ